MSPAAKFAILFLVAAYGPTVLGPLVQLAWQRYKRKRRSDDARR